MGCDIPANNNSSSGDDVWAGLRPPADRYAHCAALWATSSPLFWKRTSLHRRATVHKMIAHRFTAGWALVSEHSLTFHFLLFEARNGMPSHEHSQYQMYY